MLIIRPTYLVRQLLSTMVYIAHCMYKLCYCSWSILTVYLTPPPVWYRSWLARLRTLHPSSLHLVRIKSVLMRIRCSYGPQQYWSKRSACDQRRNLLKQVSGFIQFFFWDKVSNWIWICSSRPREIIRLTPTIMPQAMLSPYYATDTGLMVLIASFVVTTLFGQPTSSTQQNKSFFGTANLLALVRIIVHRLKYLWLLFKNLAGY